MATTRNRPILVTGSHRCGSTFVGHMIAAHPKIEYLAEPFNPDAHRGRTPVTRWFRHVTAADERPVRAYLDTSLKFGRSWRADFASRPGWHGSLYATRRTLTAWYRWATDFRPLMKDPIALMSAEWLARTYDMDVLVLIRHPAAFVSSLVRLGWQFPFGDLLAQPELMRDHLAPFAREIADYAAEPRPVIDEGILLWRIFHHVIRQYQLRHPEWLFVRHEDLSQRPREEFATVFARLGLRMTPDVQRMIDEHTAAENPREAPGNVAHHLRLDSRANVWNWAHRLSPLEVAKVRKHTEDIARHFYSDAEWADGAAPLRNTA